MRLLITAGIFPPDIGGPATYVPRIAAALQERGHAVTVLTLSEPLSDPPAFRFPVLRLPRRAPLPVRLARTVAGIVRAARSADLMFANGLFEETALAAALAGRPCVAKVVGDQVWERARNRGWTAQEIEAFQSAPPARVRWMRAVQRRAMRRAVRVIVPSAYLGRIVQGWGVSAARIAVVPNAVEFHPIPDRDAAKRRLGLDGTVLLSAGRLVSWKRIDQLLRAAAGLPVQVVVAGEGPERSRLERLAADLGLHVRFTGGLPADALAAYFGAADLFVLTSTYEGFPHVVLEAMAAGVPVVAAAAGGTPEVVRDGENGILVPPEDTEGFRAALLRLLSSPQERQRLALAGRRVAGTFTLERMVDQTEAVLQGVVRGRP